MGNESDSASGWNRRTFCLGTAAFSVAGAGCTTTGTSDGIGLPSYFERRSTYRALRDEPYPVPAVNIASVDTRLQRQTVQFKTRERPGTIIVDPYDRYLYFVQANDRAIRYGVGVGRAGYLWSGRAYVGWKQAWPTWTPPPAMIARLPELAEYRKGLEPGLRNPLGARAIYIYRDGKDTLYRLHGTNEPRSIGRANSSGCIRLFNQDIIDLYDRVKTGTKIVVLTQSQSSRIV